jgi:demethylmenaquinone methyltransferase/2-methoxy-6-polyprenyl-1,4-benzoquinol methylase
MFDDVAGKYDLTDTLLTVGVEKLWRRATVGIVDPKPGQRVLDLACGTGTSTRALAKTGAAVVGCDFSEGMLQVAQHRLEGLGVWLVAGDATNLPFADDSFDAVSISFGLRNVADVPGALAEMLRVTRPGGTLTVCEFSRPRHKVVRCGYGLYLTKVIPVIARLVATNPEAYTYLAASIAAWPHQYKMDRQLARAGWRDVMHRNLTGGIVAVHRARKPRTATP